MKNILGFLFFVLLGNLNIFGLEIGDSLPVLKAKMKATDGRTLGLEEIKGKNGTLVIFTCNHCPFAKKWQSRTTELANAYLKKGVGVIAINSNDAEAYPEDSISEMKKLAEGKVEQFPMAWSYPYVVDENSDFARAFGALKTPEYFLFNSKSKLVYHGALDGNADEPANKETFLKNALDELLAGKKISLATTPAFGCGIKFKKRS